MRSSFFGLEIGKKALQAQQIARDVTAHNAANLNTEGYSRQSGIMVTPPPDNVPSLNRPSMRGFLGTGVWINEVVRARNMFYDQEFRRQNISLGMWEMRTEHYMKIELILNEGSDNGISNVYDTFWSSWQEMEKTPEHMESRAVVQQWGAGLASSINSIYTAYRDYRVEMNDMVIMKKDEINSLGQQIRDLNMQIQDLEITGSPANDLLDKRDLLIDKLAKIVNIRISDRGTGKLRISIGDYDLVDHDTFNSLGVQRRTSERGVAVHDLYWERTGITLTVGDNKNISGGELRAILDTRDVELPYQIRQLDELVYQTIKSTNELHMEGYGLIENAAVAVRGGADATFSEIEVDELNAVAGMYRVVMLSTNGAYRVERYVDNGLDDQGWVPVDDPSTGTVSIKLPTGFGTSRGSGVISRINVEDTVGDSVLGAGDTVNLTFTEALDPTAQANFADEIANSAVWGAGPGATVVWSADGTTATITLGNNPTLALGDVYTLDPAATPIINAAGDTLVDPGTGTGVLGTEFNAQGLTFTIEGLAEYQDTWNFTVVQFENDPPKFRLGSQSFFNVIDTSNLTQVITVNEAILDEKDGLSRIAAALQFGKAGDADNALRIAQLKHAQTMGSFTFNGFISSISSDLAVRTQDAFRQTDNQILLITQVEQMRLSVSAVDEDEEMTNLIRFQHAYEAASRIITTIDEMLDLIVNRMGIVGRG